MGSNSEFQTSDGVRYWTDMFGVVHQVDLTVTATYDVDYVRSRYDSIPERVQKISRLRAGFILAAAPPKVMNVLDVGYGNGAFLREMFLRCVPAYGYDVTGYPLPDGCRAGELRYGYDVVTLFDTLEHLPAPREIIDLLSPRVLVVTAPLYYADTFDTWKHRRPGEHLHHYTPESLSAWLGWLGYRLVAQADFEDRVRGRLPDGRQNTFTCLYEAGSDAARYF